LSLALVPAAWLAGCLLVGLLEGPAAVRAYPFATWLTGLVLTALLVLGAGCVNLQAAQMLAILMGGGGVYVAFKPWGRLTTVDLGPTRDEQPLPEWATWTLFVALGLSFAFAFLASLAPVTGWDAASLHLALPAAFARAGQIAPRLGHDHSPLLHALYTVSFAGGGERSVTLMNWVFGVAACGAVYGLARELAGRYAGLVAAAILATTPVFAHQMGSPSIDLAFAALATTALWMVVRWSRSGDGHALLFAAVLAGSSCGVRHTGLLLCVLLAVGVALCSPGVRAKATLLFSLAALLALLPWTIYIFMASGLPAAPTLPEPTLVNLVALLRFPWDVVMRPQDLDGWMNSSGALMLVLGVPGLFLGGRAAWGLGGYGLAGSGAVFFARSARLMLPFFSPMIALAGVAVVRLTRLRGLAIALLLLHVAYGLALHAATVYPKLPAALGMVARQDYLDETIERMALFNYANRQLTGSRVWSIDPRTYFLHTSVRIEVATLKQLAGMNADAQYQALQAQGIEYILYSPDYVAKADDIREAAEALLKVWQADKERYPLAARVDCTTPRFGAEEALVFRVNPSASADAPAP
jgi:hypothetical protein